MAIPLTSESVNSFIDEMLLSGRASTAFDAEELFLNEHLNEIALIIFDLNEAEFENHEAIKLLMAHGSRRLEDALP